jgi:hypothetical protein
VREDEDEGLEEVCERFEADGGLFGGGNRDKVREERETQAWNEKERRSGLEETRDSTRRDELD